MRTIPEFDVRQMPHIAQLQALFDERHRLSRSLIGRAITTFGLQWGMEFEQILSSLFADREALAAAAKGYATFAFDSMRRQKAFEETRTYVHKTYAQAASDVYFNERHMMEEYLPGLLLSHYLWPHHYRQLQFFDMAFASAMRLSSRQTFAEIGVGTGVYSRRLLDCLPACTGSGYDISPASCRFAQRHVEAAGVQSRYTINKRDIITRPIDAVSWLVCVEVLEHLEQPAYFLRTLRAGLAPGGKAFITAALNAAHADHAYLYRSASEVWRHLGEAGFALEQSFVGASHPSPSPDGSAPLVAAFVVS